MRFEPKAVTVVRRNRWLLALPTLFVFGHQLVGLVRPGSPPMLVMALALLAWVWQRNPSPRESPTAIVGDENGITHEGEVVVHRGEVRNAVILPDSAGPLVRFTLRQGDEVVLRLTDVGEARALLVAMKLDRAHAVATFSARAFDRERARWHDGDVAPVLATIGVFMALILLGLGAAPVFAAPLVYVAVRQLLGRRVEVGADGLCIADQGTRRFVPYRDVKSVSPSGRGVVLEQKDGAVLELLTTAAYFGDARHRDALLLAIEDALAFASSTPAAPETAAESLLARGDRPVETWVRDARSLGGEGGAGYRAQVVPPPVLLHVALEPSADPSARVAAALALGPYTTAEERARVRAAFESSAAPVVRVALDADLDREGERDLVRALENMRV